MLNVVKRPLISEKNSLMAEDNIYVFEVDKKATKTEVKAAVERFFQVKVSDVRTSICRNRGKRTKVGMTKVKYWKKAMVKLQPGEKIALFEGA